MFVFFSHCNLYIAIPTSYIKFPFTFFPINLNISCLLHYIAHYLFDCFYISIISSFCISIFFLFFVFVFNTVSEPNQPSNMSYTPAVWQWQATKLFFSCRSMDMFSSRSFHQRYRQNVSLKRCLQGQRTITHSDRRAHSMIHRSCFSRLQINTVLSSCRI